MYNSNKQNGKNLISQILLLRSSLKLISSFFLFYSLFLIPCFMRHIPIMYNLIQFLYYHWMKKGFNGITYKYSGLVVHIFALGNARFFYKCRYINNFILYLFLLFFCTGMKCKYVVMNFDLNGCIMNIYKDIYIKSIYFFN